MPRPCDVCSSPRRLDAERRCASGEPVSGVARELGMSRDALRRYMVNHVAPTTRAVSLARAAAEGQAVVLLPPDRSAGTGPRVVDLPTLQSVAAGLQALKARAGKILDDAEREGSVHGRVAATGALVAVLDRLGKVAQLLAPPAPPRRRPRACCAPASGKPPVPCSRPRWSRWRDRRMPATWPGSSRRSSRCATSGSGRGEAINHAERRAAARARSRTPAAKP